MLKLNNYCNTKIINLKDYISNKLANTLKSERYISRLDLKKVVAKSNFLRL